VTEYKLRFVYTGGDAEDNRLDLYDGAVSLQGIARSLAITTHAFINGEVRTRADIAHGASLYLYPSRRGSFVLEAAVWMTAAVASGVFYDFIRYTYKEAVGALDDSDEPGGALEKRIEPTLGELPAVLESSLTSVHRPITQDPKIRIAVTRPRGEELIVFDAQTANALLPVATKLLDPILGHVTRYNTISRWGRFYDYSEKRVISFFLEANISDRERSLITWSLHQANVNGDGTLYMFATADVTPTGKVKRYTVSKVSDRPLP
jgi:hypothetical protein